MTGLPPLAAIRVFEAAARHLNYTRAAEELGLTQAGVSYQIKVLEERLGTVLFLRDGRGMALTPDGETLAPLITQSFSQMASAFDRLRDSDDGVLSIACSQTFATQFLAPRLGTFQIAYPDIAVRLDVSDRLVDLEAGECDLAIRLTPEPPEKLRWHFLMRLGITAMMSPGFALDLGVDEYTPLPTEARVSPTYVWWEKWDESRGTSAQSKAPSRKSGLLQFDSQMLDAQAAIAGNGAALLAPALFKAEMADGRLVRPYRHIAWLASSFRLIYPDARARSPKVRAFRSWLERELKKMVGEDPDGFLRDAS